MNVCTNHNKADLHNKNSFFLNILPFSTFAIFNVVIYDSFFKIFLPFLVKNFSFFKKFSLVINSLLSFKCHVIIITTNHYLCYHERRKTINHLHSPTIIHTHAHLYWYHDLNATSLLSPPTTTICDSTNEKQAPITHSRSLLILAPNTAHHHRDVG